MSIALGRVLGCVYGERVKEWYDRRCGYPVASVTTLQDLVVTEETFLKSKHFLQNMSTGNGICTVVVPGGCVYLVHWSPLRTHTSIA